MDVEYSLHELLFFFFFVCIKGHNLCKKSSNFVCSFGFADGPAEDLYGIFINRVRRERPPEFLEKVRG